MKKKKVRKRFEKAIKAKQICKVYTEYDQEEPLKFLPLQLGEDLIFMVRDGDAASNGYSVRSLDVIEKVKVEDGGGQPFPLKEASEGALVPEVDLTDWASVFKSLGKYGKVVIVESEKLPKKDGRYAIGRIEKIGRKQVTIRYYGPDTGWENKRWKIPYEDVTWVTAESRYTEVLTHYVPEREKNAGAEMEPDEAGDAMADSREADGCRDADIMQATDDFQGVEVTHAMNNCRDMNVAQVMDFQGVEVAQATDGCRDASAAQNADECPKEEPADLRKNTEEPL